MKLTDISTAQDMGIELEIAEGLQAGFPSPAADHAGETIRPVLSEMRVRVVYVVCTVVVEYVRCPWHASEAFVGRPLRDFIEDTSFEAPLHKVCRRHDAHAGSEYIITSVAECRNRVMCIRIFEFCSSLRTAWLSGEGHGCQKAEGQQYVFHNYSFN